VLERGRCLLIYRVGELMAVNARMRGLAEELVPVFGWLHLRVPQLWLGDP
jgi:hypothetical protein